MAHLREKVSSSHKHLGGGGHVPGQIERVSVAMRAMSSRTRPFIACGCAGKT
jgi:hypothetical protein